MEQAQLDPVLQRLVAGLHTRAWFSFEGTPQVVASTTGGRQGCKLSCLVFCAVYEQALQEVRRSLRDEQVACTLRLEESQAFWAEPSAAAVDVQERAEATYVDDEALAVVATTAKRLRVAMQTVVATFGAVSRASAWRSTGSEASRSFYGCYEASVLQRNWTCAEGRTACSSPRMGSRVASTLLLRMRTSAASLRAVAVWYRRLGLAAAP